MGNISKNRATYREVIITGKLSHFNKLSSKNVEEFLSKYESVMSQATEAGIDISTQNYTISWDYIQAIFFSTTILTTIGGEIWWIKV